MIRVRTLFCKLNSINISDKRIFDICSMLMGHPKDPCSSCGNDSDYTGHSGYTRMMISIIDGQRSETEVTIPRVKCHCGRTHALLPEILIPYSSYSLRFILTVLCAFCTRSCSVIRFCEKWQISVSTIYRWIHMFIGQYNLFFGAIEELKKITVASIETVTDIPSFISAFYGRFRFSFMQCHHKTSFCHT